MVAAVAIVHTSEEAALAARLLEANRARSQLLRERDALQDRVDQLEDALALARTRLAVADGRWRHELRCDYPACKAIIAVVTNEPADPKRRLARALAAAATAAEWVIGNGTDTAAALGTSPAWNGGDLCPACRAKSRAAGKSI